MATTNIGNPYPRRKLFLSQVCLLMLLAKIKFSQKGALTWYGKLTWDSAHALNLIILSYFIVWGMTFIFIVYLSFYAIPLLIYDVMNDITIIP